MMIKLSVDSVGLLSGLKSTAVAITADTICKQIAVELTPTYR